MEKKIYSKKRGNAPGFWFFKTALKLTGLRGAYGLLYFVCLYYIIFDRQAFDGASAYIKRRFPGSGIFQTFFHVYCLFISQGKQLVDRAACMSGTVDFRFSLDNPQQIERAASSEKGMILLTAHAGNWQIALSTLKNIGKKVYLVMRPEDNDAVKKALDICGCDDLIQVISPEGHLGGVVPVMNALNQGHIVSFMGDRPYGFEAVDVDFMGDKASFPCGPFNIAAVARVPVMILLAPKLAHRHYMVDVTNVLHCEYEGRKNKKKQLAVFAQRYADILSGFVKEYPYQCFLFCDVWS